MKKTLILNPSQKRRAFSPPHLGRVHSLLADKNYWAKFDAKITQRHEEIAATRKDAVLNIRINSRDLARLKEKAAKAGIKYQPFITALLHYASR